jgi:hypothetical protein
MEIVTDKVIQRLEWIKRTFGYPFEDVYVCSDQTPDFGHGTVDERGEA